MLLVKLLLKKNRKKEKKVVKTTMMVKTFVNSLLCRYLPTGVKGWLLAIPL